MSKTKTFDGVTSEVFECMKQTSEREHDTHYTPGDKGTATTAVLGASVVLNFEFNAASKTITYTIVKKPFLVSDDQIWNGVKETLDGCSG